ncbi:MAG: hypothetical protein ACRD96_11865, partial [Bryobacteraceae bacterium]
MTAVVTPSRVLAGAAVAATVVMLLAPPIGQDAAYHRFADRRSLAGIPNFGDAMSNAAFAVVGAM